MQSHPHLLLPKLSTSALRQAPAMPQYLTLWSVIQIDLAWSAFWIAEPRSASDLQQIACRTQLGVPRHIH
jgi:hypothetical protein